MGNNNGVLTDEQIRATVRGMGVDHASVAHDNRIDTIYVSFYRSGGCGKIHKNVKEYLFKHFGGRRGKRVVMIPQVREGEECDAFELNPGDRRFVPTRIVATERVMGC